MAVYLENEYPHFILLTINTIGTASANSVESDLGCKSRIYFDNVTLTLHNAAMTSQV